VASPFPIAGKNERDRAALMTIGAPAETIVVSGSFKFDVAGHAAAAIASTRQDSRPVVVAGSTHHPEEALLFDACQRLRESFEGLQLIVAPRDVRRARRVAAAARARGFQTALASQGPHSRSSD